MKMQEFNKTILPLKDKLFRYSLRIVGNSMEAEDVVQEVFIKLWKKRDDLHRIDNIDAWCTRVTKNLSIDKLRSKHNKSTSGLPEGAEWHSKDISPERSTEVNDTLNRVKALINRLPEKQRIVMHLRDIEQLTYKEIAQSTEMKMEQVKVYLHRARIQIRKQLLKSESYGI